MEEAASEMGITQPSTKESNRDNILFSKELPPQFEIRDERMGKLAQALYNCLPSGAQRVLAEKIESLKYPSEKKVLGMDWLNQVLMKS